MTILVSIYGLIDPREGRVRYVGQTIQTPSFRRDQHMAAAGSNTSTRAFVWLRTLREEGVRPDVVVLEEVAPEDAKAAETKWIRALHSEQYPLVNTMHTGQVSLSNEAWRRESERRLAAIRAAFPVAPVAPVAISADELRSARERLGWSQADLAKATGYHYSAVSLWESGKRSVPPRLRLVLERLGAM